jgi:hypothetical protein
VGVVEWRSEDAWLLLSVFYARKVWSRWCSVRAIIATADAINHAVFNEDELDGAVRRLSSAGLLAVEGERMALTAAGRGLVRQVRAKSWHDEWDRLLTVLSDVPPPDQGNAQRMPSGAYDRAIERYLES